MDYEQSDYIKDFNTKHKKKWDLMIKRSQKFYSQFINFLDEMNEDEKTRDEYYAFQLALSRDKDLTKEVLVQITYDFMNIIRKIINIYYIERSVTLGEDHTKEGMIRLKESLMISFGLEKK